MEDNLKRIFFYLRLYFLLTSQYLKSRMQYRFDFIISLFSIILGNVVSIISLWIIMTNILTLSGWNFNQLLFIYSFSLIVQSPFQIIFDHVWQLHTHIIHGTFIKYYFKPLPTLFYYVTETIDLKGFGQLLIGISTLFIASKRLCINWTLIKVIAFPLAVFGGSLVVISVMLIGASSCFWIKDSTSVLTFLYNLKDNTRYPIDIYSNWIFKFIMTWVIPLGLMAYYPSQIFFNTNSINWKCYISPIYGLFIFSIAVKLWNKGVSIWGGTGS